MKKAYGMNRRIWTILFLAYHSTERISKFQMKHYVSTSEDHWRSDVLWMEQNEVMLVVKDGKSLFYEVLPRGITILAEFDLV